MPDYWFERQMDDGSLLVLSVLTRDDYDAFGGETMNMGNDCGYFLRRYEDGEIVDILAKVDADYVMEMAGLLGML